MCLVSNHPEHLRSEDSIKEFCHNANNFLMKQLDSSCPCNPNQIDATNLMSFWQSNLCLGGATC